MREKSVYDRALTLLAFRARSVAELRRKLLQADADPGEVEEVLQRLQDQKLLDDHDFAGQFARGKFGGGVSQRRVVQELGRKGISRDVAQAAIGRLREEEGIDPASGIHAVAARKWAQLGRLDDATRRRRLYGFLARRGFSPDEIRAAMAAVGAAVE